MWYRKSICNQDTIGKSRFMFFASKTKDFEVRSDFRRRWSENGSGLAFLFSNNDNVQNGSRQERQRRCRFFFLFFLDSQFGKNLKQKASFVEEESRCRSRTSPSPEKRKKKQWFWRRKETAVLGQGGSEICESIPHRKSTWNVASWQKLKKIITRVIPRMVI